MKDPNCTQCQEWEICPFHPTDEAPVTERLPEPARGLGPTTEESMREWLANDPKLRLLGPDDPEVSSDLIYLNEATGGLVGVPQSPARPSVSLRFEGALITVYPAPDATAADVAHLIAAQIPGAWVDDGRAKGVEVYYWQRQLSGAFTCRCVAVTLPGAIERGCVEGGISI